MKILTIILLVLIVMSGQLNADNHSATNNKITLKLTDTSEVSVTGFIAPIENTGSNFHVEWDALANLRVAEPEKRHPASVFQAFLPNKPVSVGDLWVPDMIGIVNLFKQLHPNPNFFSPYQCRGFVRFVGVPARLQRSIRRHCVSDPCGVQTRRWVVYTVSVHRTSCH